MKLKEVVKILKDIEKRYTVHMRDSDSKKLRKVIEALER